MQIEVVDPHGEPLENARVFASIWTDEKQFKANREYMSDAKGIARIELPKTLTILRLWVSKPGHSALFINFSTDEREAKPLVIPESLTFRLLKGTVMGGIVKNDEGKGIEGVRIQTRYDGGGVKLDGAFNHSLDDKVVTDADGRWRLDTVPPGEKVQIRLELEHPDYISHQPWREVQRAQKVTSEALRSEASVIVMQYGNSVTGTVTAQGQPVENAVVIWGDHPYWEQGPQEVRTNSKGVYRFPPLPTGPMRVTVVAEGWSPDSRRIEITPKPPATDFALRRGKKLRIRFVDQRGAPVPDVYVSIENWRGAEALYNHKHPDVIDVKIPHLADKEGVFEWGWAPDDGVRYRFSKVGFAETTATITAGDSEQTQTLQPVLRFAGSVRDAATGQPIDDFLAIPVIYFRPDFPLLDRSHAVRQKGGRLNLELDRTDIEHGVQVEAAGYEMYRSPQRHSIGSALPELDIRLKRAAKFLGKVMDAEGRPVSGARVYVATQFQHLDLQRLKDRDGNQTHNYSVNTAADGTFEIIPPIERYALVVIADLGYAEVERDVHNMPGDIRIQPWARVSGRLLQSGKPVSNHSVFLEPIRNDGVDQPRVNCDFQGHSEEDGTFVFENVPPIPCRVRAFVHFSRETPLRSGHSIPLQLSPGEQVQVELGTGGIDVTGQLVVENAPADFDYHFSLSYLVARKPGITPPAHLDARGFDWRKGWSDAWRGTQEGQAYLNTLHHWFVKPTPDGRILISGVEPGEYDFAVHLYGSTEGCLVHPVATRVIPVTVKPGQKELDLGRLVIPSLTLPKVGDMASDFEFTGLDGKRTSLGAHRGKYVLLDFWATWCSPCVAKLDAVEGLRRELAAENRLVVIGVNLDADIDRAKQFLGKRPLPWEHALLGEWSNTDVPARFAVSNVPTYILVGPDGRIVAHEYLFETVSTKLKKLMEGSAEDGKPGK